MSGRTGASPTVHLPRQRRAVEDSVVLAGTVPRPVVPRGWGSTHDQAMARWLLLMMVSLSLYAGFFVWLGTRAV